MSRVLAILYAVIAYVMFLGTFLYAIAFVGNLGVPHSIDVGPAAPLQTALLIDVVLLGVFAVQHSLMARPFFKQWWTKFVPPSVERSTYVLFSNLALILLYWQWRPITMGVWTVTGIGAGLLAAIFWAGWLIVLLSTFMISHFELFGLTQVWLNFKQQNPPSPQFKMPLFYGFVRHPIYLGFILAFWAAPIMTAGHLIFSLATTAYILIAIQFEEHDLVALFGDSYRNYRRQISMLIPMPPRS
ncbi:MAG TPA: hypothetical protein VN685_08210 [Rhizomicrobium sp.]|nr:hypothetical protein [Rhizomicrobium sp.]